MVRIRLQRQGKRNDPFYRIVVTEKTRKRSGLALSILGTWHPRDDELKINKKEYAIWIAKGAQVSSAVKNLIK